MKLKPLTVALGLNPQFWMHRFSFISKQVYLGEKLSHNGFAPRLSAMGRDAQARVIGLPGAAR